MVLTREHGYELELDPDCIDAHRFEQLIAQGTAELAAGRPQRALSALEKALSLWRGAPLGELAYESFAQREIARLDALRVAAHEQLIDAKLALGRHGEVPARLEALIAEHPYREHLRAQLMLALYRSDRQADALQAYQNARRTLVEELGIEPGERLRELERAILAQDPGLHRVAAEEPAGGKPAAPGGARSPQGSTLNLRTAHGSPMLEREEELQQLRSAWEGALAGHGRLVVVEGAAGSGKSALLAAATEVAAAAGLRVLGARGSEMERGLAFGAVRQLFEAVVTSATPAEREELLAGAAAPAAWVVAPAVERGAEARAEAGFGALHAIFWLATNLSLARPQLLAVDDLHWAGVSSVRALAYLARRIVDLPTRWLWPCAPTSRARPSSCSTSCAPSPTWRGSLCGRCSPSRRQRSCAPRSPRPTTRSARPATRPARATRSTCAS